MAVGGWGWGGVCVCVVGEAGGGGGIEEFNIHRMFTVL